LKESPQALFGPLAADPQQPLEAVVDLIHVGVFAG
jgi:hypothetical protein